MRRLRYEEPPHLPHDEADSILSAALRGETTKPDANSVLVGLALFDDDREFVEAWCVRIAREAPDLWLRGLASLCIGTHLARRFRAVGEEATAVVRELAADEQMRAINPQVLDAAEDLAIFLRSDAQPEAAPRSWPERRHTLPDGRELSATYEGEPVGWVVHLVGREERPVAARDIHDALVELLEPDEGGWPSWFMEAADDLAARDTPLGRRYPCPCCGYLTLDEAPTGTYNICKVCFWEDDGVQFHNLDYEGGANKASLHQARQNFREYGVSEVRFKAHVREPLPEEQP